MLKIVKPPQLSLALDPISGAVACPAGLEPTTPSLEGWCSIQLSYGQSLCRRVCKPGRGGEIRTPDILLPKQARYQAAPHPEKGRT
jgi:hypothetical protein